MFEKHRGLKWQLALFIFVHIAILLVFALEDYGGIDGTYVFWDQSSKIVTGSLPYRDFSSEYPPLGLVFITLPRLLSSTPGGYFFAFAIELFIFDLLGMFVMAKLAERIGLAPWKALGIYSLALLALGRLVIMRFDLIPAIVTLLALYLFVRGKYKSSWALVAVGTLTKIYPILVAPILLIFHFRRSRKREILGAVATFGIICAVIVLPVIWLSPGGFSDFILYHARRGLQIESTYGSFLLLVGRAFGLTHSLDQTYGSVDIAAPQASFLATLSTPVMLLSLMTVYWLYHREQESTPVVKGGFRPPDQSDTAGIIRYAALVTLAFIITGKVLSPQYIIWVVPLVPLVTGRWRNDMWVMMVIVCAVTYLIYPVKYLELVFGGSLRMQIVLVCRNVSLIVLAVLAATTGKTRHVPLSKETVE